jgi:hypothetical protein
MVEDIDKEQEAMGWGFILGGPIAFTIVFLIIYGICRNCPIEQFAFLGFLALICTTISVLGTLILRFRTVFIILRLILPDD